MIITHAISGPAGTAILLLAALGLLVGIVVWAVRARARSTQNLAVPDAVPLWWDQLPAAGTPAGQQSSPTHG